MQDELEVARGKPDEEFVLEVKSNAEAGLGKLKQSSATIDELKSIAEKSGTIEFAASVEADRLATLPGPKTARQRAPSHDPRLNSFQKAGTAAKLPWSRPIVATNPQQRTS